MLNTTHRIICPNCTSASMMLDVDERGVYYTITCIDCDTVVAERVSIHEVHKDG